MRHRWLARAKALHPCQNNTCRQGVMLRDGMEAAALHELAHAADWECCEPGSPCLECFSCVAGYFGAFSSDAVQEDVDWFEQFHVRRTVICLSCDATIYLGDLSLHHDLGKTVVCGSCRASAVLSLCLTARMPS